MKADQIIFFNHWRNGDCYINKEYVRDIISRYSNVKFYYAHNNHQEIILDLNVTHLHINEIANINTFTPLAFDKQTNTLYINTWVGCWIGKHLKEKEHANFYVLHRMWKEVFDALELEMKGDYFYYLPEIHWHYYDMTLCNQYLQSVKGKRLFVFCNGKQQSEQSSMGDMANIIFNLASKYSHCEFFVTDKVDVDLSNVKFSEDILKSTTGNLNKISYITHYSELIVGKNSGPFTYAHTKSNMNNVKQTFMCFSHFSRDCLMGEGTYLCNSYFSDTIDDNQSISILENLIENPMYSSIRKATCHETKNIIRYRS